MWSCVVVCGQNSCASVLLLRFIIYVSSNLVCGFYIRNKRLPNAEDAYSWVSLTSATFWAESKWSRCTAVTPLTNHVRFAFTLASNSVTNQRPILVPPSSRGITVTRWKKKFQKMYHKRSVLTCWNVEVPVWDCNNVGVTWRAEDVWRLTISRSIHRQH